MVTHRLSRQEEQILHTVLEDRRAYIENFIQIPSKEASQRRVPFKLWAPQEKLYNAASGRDIVIKDSQVGCTSYWSADFLVDTILTPDTTTVIIANTDFLTKRLLNRVQVMYDSIPDWAKPKMDHSSTFEKSFPSINSIIYIGTAGAQVFGRGEPIHNLLLSEEAFYVTGSHEKIVLPALQRVPEGGRVVRESTPNGESGAFYEEVQLAQKDQSTFKLHTLFWWENPDNTTALGSITHKRMVDRLGEAAGQMSELDGDEQLLLESGVNLDQLRWRRYKIAETGVMFQQEHMEDIEKCFLQSGEPFYEPEVTSHKTSLCYKAPYTGPENSLVWFRPEEGGSYVMGIDPGQGKRTESVLQVWRADLEHPRMECRLSGFFEPEVMAPKVRAVARYYGTPLIVPEDNAHGHGLVSRLVDKPRYPRMYMRKDIVDKRPTTKPGWLTSGRTKAWMCQQMKVWMSDMECYDSVFWAQVRGGREAEGKKVIEFSGLDDHQDAGALSVVGLTGYVSNKTRGFQGSSGWEW